MIRYLGRSMMMFHPHVVRQLCEGGGPLRQLAACRHTATHCRISIHGMCQIALPLQRNKQILWQQKYHFTTSSCVFNSKYIPQVPEEFKDTHFTVFYRFPHIVLVSKLSRLKLYQTALTMILIPPTVFMYITGGVTGGALATSCGVSVFACVMLYIMSYFFRRFVGLISLSDCGKTVRLSHLNFWGRRNDVYISTQNIVPLSELPEKPSEVYIKLRRYDSEAFLLFSLRWGRILDADKFALVFGEVLRR